MASQQLQMVVEMLRSQPIAEGASFEEMRAGMEAAIAAFPTPEGASYEAADADGVPVEWTRMPGVRDDAVLLYVHGGGYCIGSIKTHRGLVARLSAAGNLRALSVEYRLAPEHPHPAAVDDAVRAYRWLLRQGVEPQRVAVGGDSAGGGLVVATLLALRDAGDPLPGAGVCISPWVDMEGTGESMTAKADADPMVQKQGLLEMAAAYLGGADPKTPLAAPLHADLAGLPPLLIQVGTAETLLDDSTRLAAKASAAGVDVTFEPWEDMIHVWHAFAPLLPEAEQGIARIGEWLRKQIS